MEKSSSERNSLTVEGNDTMPLVDEWARGGLATREAHCSRESTTWGDHARETISEARDGGCRGVVDFAARRLRFGFGQSTKCEAACTTRGRCPRHSSIVPNGRISGSLYQFIVDISTYLQDDYVSANRGLCSEGQLVAPGVPETTSFRELVAFSTNKKDRCRCRNLN